MGRGSGYKRSGVVKGRGQSTFVPWPTLHHTDLKDVAACEGDRRSACFLRVKERYARYYFALFFVCSAYGVVDVCVYKWV